MMNKQAGVTLVEVLVAFMIISIGMLGIATMQRTTLQQGFDTAQRSQALWLVQELVERMRANQDGLATGYTTAVANAGLCDAAPAEMCGDHKYNSGAKVDAVATCDGNDMASFDVWEVMCGYTNAGMVSNSSDSIILTAINITCEDITAGACGAGTNFTVSADWTSRALDTLNSGPGAQSTEQATRTISITMRPN